jgi:hypothetical protein
VRVKPKEEIIRGLRRREAVCGGSDGERKKRKKKKKKNKRKNMTLDDEDFDMLEENVADYQRPQAVRAVAATPSALLNRLFHCTLSTTCKSSHCLLRPHTSLCAMARRGGCPRVAEKAEAGRAHTGDAVRAPARASSGFHSGRCASERR